jgi:hypothetical protein
MSWWERKGQRPGDHRGVRSGHQLGLSSPVPGVAAIFVFCLLHQRVRATQRWTYRRVPPWLAR